MTRHLAAQQDLLSNLIAAHRIHSGSDDKDDKITIERLEMHMGQPVGVGLAPGRVHALSTVRRRRPLYLLPPRPEVVVNRPAELESLRQTVLERKTTDLYGPNGAGKSTLAASLVHTLDLSHFPDGIVFVTGQIPHHDLLQALFDGFYESDSPVKVTPQQTHTYLHNLRVLVILDDVSLTPQQTDPILDALNEAAVLLIGPDRTAPGRGPPLALQGLARQEAVTLFEKVLGRTPSPDESLLVEQICALFNDMPLPISGVAAHAAQDKRSLTRLLTDLQEHKPWAGPGGDPSIGPALEQMVLFLDETDRHLLTLIAAFAGPNALDETLRALVNLSADDFQKRVERLHRLGLLRAIKPTRWILPSRSRRKSAPRLALVPAYYQAVRNWLVDDAARQEIVNFYTSRLSRGDQLPGDELFNLLGAIEDCAHNGWLDALKPLVRAADRSLARLGWWAEWQHILDLTRRAAQTGGDRALEAWALHQLGSLLGALSISTNETPGAPPLRTPDGDSSGERAFRALRTALRLRQAMGDQAGAALSARNLKVLDRLLPAPPPVRAPAAPPAEEQEPSVRDAPQPPAPQPEKAATPQPAPAPSEIGKRHRPRLRLRLRLALLIAIVLLTAGALALQFTKQGPAENVVAPPGLTISWEFGDAWNAYDNQTWTQQVIIVIKDDDDGEYRYFANDEPVGEMFEVVLPLCDGTQGTIRVESESGESAEVQYEFDSPFCR